MSAYVTAIPTSVRATKDAPDSSAGFHAVATQELMLLSEEQIASFHENGFLSIGAVATADEIAALVPIYDDLFDRRVGFEQGNYFDFAGENDRDPALPQILRPSKYEPRLRHGALYRNCAALAAQLLGPTAEFVFDHAMVKPPGGPPTALHQDLAFWHAGMRHRIISFWIPLQEATEQNGCLRYIPRSNHGPLHAHRSIGGDPRKHGLEAVGVTDEAAVSCPLPAGGATVHHWLTCHGAHANATSAPRRAYVMAFGALADRPLVSREYPWNRRKTTERARRHRASLRPWRRIKQEVKFRLTRWRLL